MERVGSRRRSLSCTGGGGGGHAAETSDGFDAPPVDVKQLTQQNAVTKRRRLLT